MRRNTEYLEWHGKQWRVAIPVPRSLQKAVGKTKLKRSLKTDSLTVANSLKWKAIAELRAEMRKASAGSPHDPLLQEALAMREALQAGDESCHGISAEEAILLRADELRGQPVDTDEDQEPVYDPDREEAAGFYHAVATGRATPLTAFLEEYHRQEVNRKERTKGDDKRALKYLEAWCRSNHVRPTLEALDRRTAGRFIGDLPKIATSGTLSNRTVNKYTSSLSNYWRWLLKRGVLETNPWREQSLPKVKRHPDDQERPFTQEEMKRLLEGTPPGNLGAIMRIAALSGARIDAIISLKVKDCQGVFRFKPQKREKGCRLVPIHGDLVPLVEALIEGKEPDEDVFPEYPEPTPGTQQERSMPAVKAFTRYRRAQGVDDTRPGLKRSLVNFHSFRRWFITRAEQAGQDGNIIAAVVGHQRPGMTLGLYSRGPSTEQLRACVEAVKLP